MNDKPRLFGIERSNRDYTVADTWGINSTHLFRLRLHVIYIQKG